MRGTAPEDGNDLGQCFATTLAGHLEPRWPRVTRRICFGATKRVSVPGPAIGLPINIVASSTFSTSVGKRGVDGRSATGGTGLYNGGLVT